MVLAPGCLTRYFPGLDPLAAERFGQLEDLYSFWNERINVISRKDLPNLCINHVLHSLSLARVIPFGERVTVLDIGTGGGFPGIPLAIMFPGVHFTLLDSTGKKIRVVENITRELGLANVTTAHTRAEDFKGLFHYVVSRAACSFTELVKLSTGNLLFSRQPEPSYGIYSLKGGDLDEELAEWKTRVKVFDIRNLFEEEYFRNKKIVFLPSVEMRVKR
jgi:16S rRNA (guanine527-N7)-methyltransferase